ncbi:MAG: MBL fold metallo-hydrolase [Eggerthellaceae bacterium]|nr:MBL fold metallo-hydrolase [Eggerthellaceae bacterium]
MSYLKQIDGFCTNVGYLVLPPLYNNCYFVSFEQDGEEMLLIVDPSSRPERIIKAVDGRTVAAIFITHGHYDHCGAAAELREHFGCQTYASTVDACLIEDDTLCKSRHIRACRIDNKISKEETIHFGNIDIDVIFTPGHSMGSLCFLVYSRKFDRSFLVSGDTLFKSSIGRTDFENSDPHKMTETLHRLSQLDDCIIVLPGHGSFTSIKEERNFYLDRK